MRHTILKTFSIFFYQVSSTSYKTILTHSNIFVKLIHKKYKIILIKDYNRVEKGKPSNASITLRGGGTLFPNFFLILIHSSLALNHLLIFFNTGEPISFFAYLFSRNETLLKTKEKGLINDLRKNSTSLIIG